MTTTGDVELTVLDGGAGVVVVPASSVAVVVGTCEGGTAGQVLASQDPNALFAAAGRGPGVDLAALVIAAGGTALFMKAATTDPGVASAVTQTGGGAVIGVSGEPKDAWLVKLVVTVAGTVGTKGIRFKLSGDAGRTFGPEIALGTADTFEIVGTGLTLSFASGTLAKGDTATFGCTPPLCTTAEVAACIAALEASPYSSSGWGALIVDGAWDGADAGDIETSLDTLVTTKTFTRAIVPARDADLPTAYGGGGTEEESDWLDAIELDYSELSAKRVCAVGGHYNIPSQFPVAAFGKPRMRRSGAWALAARQVAIPPQRHAGRVNDGSLAQIIVDPANDPNDGFIYHDERTSPSLDGARFTSFRTRKGKGGFFVVNPKLMAPTGSVFTLLPLGNVMDIGCSLLYQTGEDEINSDILLNDNGTIEEKAAQHIESISRGVLRDQMLAKSMISNYSYVIDRTNNVRQTSEVNFAATLYSRGYILQINGTIGFGNATGG